MTKLPRYCLLGFLFLAALFLSTEVWMQVAQHKSLCTTSSCAVVGEYVRFGEGNLIKLGAIFFWVLWALAFYAGRFGRNWLWVPTCMAFLGALAFDGALLGFQFMALKEHCLLCIIVALCLFTGALLLAWELRRPVVFFLGLAVWCGGFVGNSVLDLDVLPPLPQYGAYLTWTGNATASSSLSAEKNAPVTSQNTTQNTSERSKLPDHTLFFSQHCDHCSKILANLSVNIERLPGTWRLACVDNKEEDLYRLMHLQNSPAAKENPFLETLRMEAQQEVAPITVSGELREIVREGRSFFKNRGYEGVPIMIVQKAPGWEIALQGEEAIIRYLIQENLLERGIFLNYREASDMQRHSATTKNATGLAEKKP